MKVGKEIRIRKLEIREILEVVSLEFGMDGIWWIDVILPSDKYPNQRGFEGLNYFLISFWLELA